MIDRILERDADDIVFKILLPDCVPATGLTLFKLNGRKLEADEYFFETNYPDVDNVLVTEEGVDIYEEDKISAIIMTGGKMVKIWEWSAKQGDIILDGKPVSKDSSVSVSSYDKNPDVCSACGGLGELRPPAACICRECGQLLWGI